MRILAVIAFVLLSFSMISEYVIEAQNLAEDREYYEERLEEHEDECDERNCSECEEYEEDLKRYERYDFRNVVYLIQYITLYGVYCAILYAVGEIATKISRKSEPEKKQMIAPASIPMSTPAPVSAPVPTPTPTPTPNYTPAQVQTPPPAPVPAFCANCGSPRKAGDLFCSECGNVHSN